MDEIQGRLDIDDAERKNREANAKKSIQDLRELREGKITNDELKERVRSRGVAPLAYLRVVSMRC
jgi:hypothetical protein